MGGKKQAQRTKNNAKPSNSGRSAEYLSSKAQFSGFSTFKESGLVLSGLSLTKTDDLDNIDTNFQLVFKKMNKKDTTTKIKALQEFAELIENSQTHEVKAVLPFWPRLYGIFVNDSEHHVREAAHKAHYQLVLKDKKNLAPYLKQLIGPWFTSQCDTYGPAATIATKSFQAAFSAEKIKNVIVFCQESLLNYLNDNLLVQTPQSIALKSQSLEEADARYIRMIISNIQGYSQYLNTIPENEISKDLNLNIISNRNFWKFSKHKDTLIKSNWFEVIAILLEKLPFLLDTSHYSNVVSAVINNLDNNNPLVLPIAWKTTLLVMSTIKDWWSFINLEKLFIPKLWKVLREGGFGNASVIYPNLLLLISHLPPSLNNETFYNSFFENLRQSLKKKTISSSRKETTAVITTLMECLQYVILKNQSNQNLCETLIKYQLITTIELILNENQISKTICSQISSLIHYWSRNRNNKDFENYQKYCQYFWDNLTVSLKNNLYNIERISDIAEKQIELLENLKKNLKIKKQQKVTFSEFENIKDTPNNIESNKTEIHKDDYYFTELKKVAFSIGETYIDLIEKKRIKILIKFLFYLIKDFDSEVFFHYLNDKTKKDVDKGSLVDFYNNILIKWLKCNYLRSKPVVDLIFLLYNYLNNEEKNYILNSFIKIVNDESLGWCISEAFTHPYNQDEIIKNWLQNEQVTNYLIEIAEKEIEGNCPTELKVLFKLAFTGEILISEEAIKRIVDEIKVPILSPDDYPFTIDSCLSLASYVSTVIYTENVIIHDDGLLMALFTFSCYNNINFETITDDTLYEVNTAWQDAVIALSKNLVGQKLFEFVEKFSEIIEKQFITTNSDSLNLERLIQIIKDFIHAIYKNHPYLVGNCFDIFFNRNFVPIWKEDITKFCMNADFLRGNLCSIYQPLNIEENKIDILKYFIWVYIKICVLIENLEDKDNEEFKILNALDEPIAANLIYDLAMAKSFIENYKTLNYHPLDIEYYLGVSLEKFKIIFKEKQKEIHNILIEKCNEGWLWCKAIHFLYTDVEAKKNLLEIYESFVNKANDLGVLHLTQLFSKHLNYEYVQNKKLNGTIENVIVLRHLIKCDLNDVEIAKVFEKIEQFRNENVPSFLFEYPNNWDSIQVITEIVRFCSSLIRCKMASLDRRHWDFCVISLVSWSSNCIKMRNKISKIAFEAFAVAIAKFFRDVDNKIKELKKENSNNNYINEWEDLFLQSIHNDIANLWLYFAEYFEENYKNISMVCLPFLEEFGCVIENFNYKFIFNKIDSSPKWTKYLKRCCSLLTNPITTLQLWGYKMLLVLVQGFIEIDSIAVNTKTPHEKGLIFEQFKEVLVQTHQICNDALMGFRLGESCQIKPFTDTFTYVLAYLLLWDVLLTLCEKSSTELHFLYADWLKKEDLLNNLLNNLFRLMPMEVLHCNENKVKTYQALFLSKPDLDMHEPCTSEKIEHLVCWIYNLSLSQLSALVRQWWSDKDSKVAQIVEKITSIYVSPSLCNQELLDVAHHETKFKNMTIKVLPTVREVIAVYTVDEARMELVISLPTNYPLGVPNVQCNKQIGGTSHKQWLMQLKKCLLHQNGRIWDGLSLWNSNLDKKFDGVEECYICFAVLHPGTYQLPKLSCQTCKKKFHSACLYKWFSTSNKSSCPICRNLF